MKSTAQVIGLFGVIQGVVIASGWLVTRSFRKIYLSINHADMGLSDYLPATSNFFASYGPVFLLIPVVWCIGMIAIAHGEIGCKTDTALIARLGLAFTVIVFLASAAMSFDMMRASICPPIRLKTTSVNPAA